MLLHWVTILEWKKETTHDTTATFIGYILDRSERTHWRSGWKNKENGWRIIWKRKKYFGQNVGDVWAWFISFD